jgi:hypothetical protein
MGPPQVGHLSEGMWLATLSHTEMAGELATFWTPMSSTVESVLERSPRKTARAEVVGELAAEFQKVERRLLKLEQLAARICDILLGPPPDRSWMADHLDEAAWQLREELVTRWGVVGGGGGDRIGGSVVFCSTGSGFGAGRCRWAVFAGDVHVRDSGAARGSN